MTCHMSPIACHVSGVQFYFFDNVVELVGGGSVINGAYLIYFSFLFLANLVSLDFSFVNVLFYFILIEIMVKEL